MKESQEMSNQLRQQEDSLKLQKEEYDLKQKTLNRNKSYKLNEQDKINLTDVKQEIYDEKLKTSGYGNIVEDIEWRVKNKAFDQNIYDYYKTELLSLTGAKSLDKVTYTDKEGNIQSVMENIDAEDISHNAEFIGEVLLKKIEEAITAKFNEANIKQRYVENNQKNKAFSTLNTFAQTALNSEYNEEKDYTKEEFMTAQANMKTFLNRANIEEIKAAGGGAFIDELTKLADEDGDLDTKALNEIRQRLADLRTNIENKMDEVNKLVHDETANAIGEKTGQIIADEANLDNKHKDTMNKGSDLDDFNVKFEKYVTAATNATMALSTLNGVTDQFISLFNSENTNKFSSFINILMSLPMLIANISAAAKALDIVLGISTIGKIIAGITIILGLIKGAQYL